MSVGKIALGVFLGNLAFALVAWFVAGIVMESRTSGENARVTQQQLEALQGNKLAP